VYALVGHRVHSVTVTTVTVTQQIHQRHVVVTASALPQILVPVILDRTVLNVNTFLATEKVAATRQFAQE